MTLYRVLIVEDTPEEGELLASYLRRYAQGRTVAAGGAAAGGAGGSSSETTLDFAVTILPSALEFVNSTHSADLVFMDIDMPGINGMEAAQIFRGYDTQTPLIFVTNLAQYAVRGYSVDALDFVVKPVSYPDFAMRMDRALRIMERNHAATIALPTASGLRVVSLRDVLYVDLLRHDVQYHLADGSVLSERGSLKAAEAKLDGSLFLRISAGCLVNMGQVTNIGQAGVTMADGSEQFFSRSQRRAALERLANFVGRSL